MIGGGKNKVLVKNSNGVVMEVSPLNVMTVGEMRAISGGGYIDARNAMPSLMRFKKLGPKKANEVNRSILELNIKELHAIIFNEYETLLNLRILTLERIVGRIRLTLLVVIIKMVFSGGSSRVFKKLLAASIVILSKH